MSDYRFGCEVTIKLPEPDEVITYNESAKWRVSEYVVSSRKGRPGSLEITRFPLYEDEEASSLEQLVPALLAAADYAENGDQT
jgi:hypothetical protein